MDFGVNQDSYAPTELLISGFPALTKPVIIPVGVSIAKNTVLGKITKGAASSAAKTGGNTGNGTLVLDETTPILAKAKAGIYKVRVIRAAIAEVATTPAVPAMEAIATLTDPDGNILEVVDVPITTGITVANQLKFVLTEGSTPFALGDGFDITIATPSTEQHNSYDADNLDGTEEADCILTEDVTGGSEAIVATAYRSGHFNESVVVGLDAKAKADLAGKGFFFSTLM
jgi:hypothetical protein